MAGVAVVAEVVVVMGPYRTAAPIPRLVPKRLTGEDLCWKIQNATQAALQNDMVPRRVRVSPFDLYEMVRFLNTKATKAYEPPAIGSRLTLDGFEISICTTLPRGEIRLEFGDP